MIVSNLDGDNQVEIIRDIVNITSIAVDPTHGKLYLAVTGNGYMINSKIISCNMDGSDVTTVFDDEFDDEEKIRNPVSLTLYNNKLYWLDTLFKYIVTVNLNGDQFQILSRYS